MKDKKFLKYLEARRNNKYPFRKNTGHVDSSDGRTKQDFPGYPHAPASKELVNPETETEKKIAGVNKKDGEKINYPKPGSEEKSDNDTDNGSANAFEETEEVKE
jgi:hypothetical protein